MSLTKEFKDFAMRGNVVDMAVGIIIGGAFGKIVSSIVADIILPPVGLLLGGVKFTDLKLIIKDAIPAQLDATGNVITELIPAVSINYGNFIQVTLDFIIIAFAIFMIIKAMNAAKKKEKEAAAPAAPPAPSKEETLLTEIRDLLKNK
jgi:large conductance mechanosensitive channel